MGKWEHDGINCYSEDELLRDFARLDPESKRRATRFIKDLLKIQRAETRLRREVTLHQERKADPKEGICCSFCGKHVDDVEQIIAGPEGYICNECVKLCNTILDEVSKEESEQT